MHTVKAGVVPSFALLLFVAVFMAGCGFGGSTQPPSGGVSGQVWAGPQCPVVRQGEACPDRPLSAPIEVRRAVDGEDPAAGRVVRRLRSDREGEFEIHLPPGSFWIIGLPLEGTPLPRPSDPVMVHIEAGQWERVELQYDSGIR